ncbi:MAG: rRNA pseudouridine synthase [Alphaproteobacteria bacterium]|nr:rRNA pseudouridine synthase [Alphaproteobacteria bacterium]
MTDETQETQKSFEGERIAKVIARAGVCSRREAEKLIADGMVTVDGKTITSPALNVQPHQRITVHGEALKTPEVARLWRFHKPVGCLTTQKDPEGRPTIFQLLPKHLPRVLAVGRLDFNTEGLLLLTNDGGLSRTLELPHNGFERVYRARVHGRVDEKRLKNLARGVRIEGVRYAPITAKLERVQGTNAWLELILREGKNREVRKVLMHLGLQVTRLIRVSYGPVQLGQLPRGMVEEIPRRTVKALLEKMVTEETSE